MVKMQTFCCENIGKQKRADRCGLFLGILSAKESKNITK